MLLDPKGEGLSDHWSKAGSALLTGAILHLLYSEHNKTMRGLAGLLSDPKSTLGETIERISRSEHDPDGSMDWRDHRGAPTPTHPLVAESMQELSRKSDRDSAGVVSTVMDEISLYRSPIIAENTEYSMVLLILACIGLQVRRLGGVRRTLISIRSLAYEHGQQAR
jgi:type IV secretion system protein VirD4